jgi:hypothetical protein
VRSTGSRRPSASAVGEAELLGELGVGGDPGERLARLEQPVAELGQRADVDEETFALGVDVLPRLVQHLLAVPLDVVEPLLERLVQRPLERVEGELGGITFTLALVQGRLGALAPLAAGDPCGEGACVLLRRLLRTFLRLLALVAAVLEFAGERVDFVVQPG